MSTDKTQQLHLSHSLLWHLATLSCATSASLLSSPAAAKSLSRVRLCATLETAAHQALPSLGFSRQEPWSGLPFPSPILIAKKANELINESLNKGNQHFSTF